MSKSYLSIPLSLRLKAYRLNGKKQLGHGWHEPAWDTSKTRKVNEAAGAKWNWVPAHTVETGLVNGESHHGCWGGAPWKIGSTETRFCDKLSTYFRNVTDAEDIVNLRHTGWYVDQFQSDKTKGIVVQLPGRDGKPIYLHGCTDPWNSNTGMIAFRQCEWTEDKEQAARWADDMAENYADFCREDAAKQQAEADIEQARERIVAIRLDLRSLIASTRESVLKPRVCQAVRDQMKELREESHELWKQITERQDNYWSAVEN